MDCSSGSEFFPEGIEHSMDAAVEHATVGKPTLSHKSTPSASSCSTYEGDAATTWSEDGSSSPLSTSGFSAVLFKSSTFQPQQVVVHKTFVEREVEDHEIPELVRGVRVARRPSSCPPRTRPADDDAKETAFSSLQCSAEEFDPATCDWASMWEASAMTMDYSDPAWNDAMAWYMATGADGAWDGSGEGMDAYAWDSWAMQEGWEEETPKVRPSWLPPPPPPPPRSDSKDATRAAAAAESRKELHIFSAIDRVEEDDDDEQDDGEPTEQAALDDPRLGTPELPTAGSAAHYLGTCKPCAFVNRNCARGTECSFCHLCGPDERKRRRKEKIAYLRQLRRSRDDVGRQRGSWSHRARGN